MVELISLASTVAIILALGWVVVNLVVWGVIFLCEKFSNWRTDRNHKPWTHEHKVTNRK